MTDKKKIPSAWKVIWKKELESGVISCKHVGCTFTCSSYEIICEHYYKCDFIPQEVLYFIISATFGRMVKYKKKHNIFFISRIICVKSASFLQILEIRL